MSFSPDNRRPDGFQVINQGVNSGVAPNLLTRQQLAWAINTTCRQGFPETRPGWSQRFLEFLDEEGNLDTSLEDNFEDGLFQGACALEAHNQLLASIGGRLFAIRVDNYQVADVSVSGDLNQLSLRRAWLVEAAGFGIVQNGADAPLIYDGAGSRRADWSGVGPREVPIGSVMAYNSGRLWVASPDGMSFAAGDIVYGPTGTATYGRRDAVLRFTENTYLSGGGSFAIPLTGGAIRAMAPIGQIDTSTGQGPLQIFTDHAVFSVAAPADRDSWASLSYPIQTVSLVDSGATGWTAPALVNGDIWYRAPDGIRSFRIGREQFGAWGNSPQSREMDRILRLDDLAALDFASAAVFDNRLLVTVQPQRDWDHGTYHPALAVLDFSPVGSVAGQSPPVWEGVWTGLRVLQLVSGYFSGVRRLFAFVLGGSDEIELWELSRADIGDTDVSGDPRSVQCSLETGALNFGGGWDRYQLEFAELWLDSLQSTLAITAEFRADQEPCWQSWATWTNCATMESCLTADETGCADTPSDIHPQYRHRIRLPQPADTVDTTSGKPYRQGFEFQVRLSWTGTGRFKKFRLWATPEPEEAFGAVPTTDTCTAKSCDSCESLIGNYSL